MNGRRALSLRETGLADWIFERVWLEGDSVFCARFARRDRRDWIEIRVEPIDRAKRCFQRLERCQVAYRGSLGDRGVETRAALHALTIGIAESIDAALAGRPGATLAAACGRSDGELELVFGRDALLGLLAPHFRLGDDVADGWVFSDVYPSEQAQSLRRDQPTLVLDFKRRADDRRLLFMVNRRGAEVLGYAESASLVLSVVTGIGTPERTETLQAMVAFALQVQDHAGIRWEFPERLELVVAPAPPALGPGDLADPARLLAEASADVARPDELVNLAIDAECGQSCAFCTAKDLTPARDGGEEAFQRLCRQLVEERRRGVERVRFNGYDPLAFSRIVELMEFATRLGYREGHVYSPFTLLADGAFCERIVAALPPERHFYVPLYAAEPQIHDRVVGRPGAFSDVVLAIEHLVARVGADRVHVESVILEQNLAALPGLVAFCAARGLSCNAHLSYPSSESRADRYYRSAPRQRDVAAALADLVAAAPEPDAMVRRMMQGVAPCITFAALRERGVAPARWLGRAGAAPSVSGTAYRDDRYRHAEGKLVALTVPCEHAARCALAEACPKEFLRAYADRFGLDEFRPVGLWELLDAQASARSEASSGKAAAND